MENKQRVVFKSANYDELLTVLKQISDNEKSLQAFYYKISVLYETTGRKMKYLDYQVPLVFTDVDYHPQLGCITGLTILWTHLAYYNLTLS